MDVELVESEYHEKDVLYEDIELLLLAVVNGEEQYMILCSAHTNPFSAKCTRSSVSPM